MRWFALAAIAAALSGGVLSPAAGEVPRGGAKPVAVPLTAALGLELDGHTFQQARAAVGAGDFNGDGLADVLIRDEPFRADSWEGRIVLGRRRGLGRRETTAGRRPVAIRGRILGDFPNFHAAGDVNGDGRGDVVVAEGGRAWVVFGRVSRRPIDLQRLGPGGFVIHSTRALGVVDAIGPVGDLDGDGLGDLAASVPAANPRSEGHSGARVAVLFGKRDGRGLVAGDAHMSAVIDPPEEALSFGSG